ncbi:hypothetical protein Tco_0731524 [Tanacetum coccineum]
MRFKKHVTTRSRKLRKGCGSANNGECCSKSVGGFVNDGEGCSKSVGGSINDGEGCSKDVGGSASPRWTRKKITEAKKMLPSCSFRLWASWMSTENSFQIKSLHLQHKCSRNYNLVSLVTYKWIAHQFAQEIIIDPFIPYRVMKYKIRQKFMIDVSLGQCKRAKQRALFDHDGGLIDHFGRLWDYRQTILDFNPGLTCVLHIEELDMLVERVKLKVLLMHLQRVEEEVLGVVVEVEEVHMLVGVDLVDEDEHRNALDHE